MTDFKSKFLQTMSERGFLYQCTNLEELDKKLASGSITGYVGYDATAKSLHVGNLVTIMMAKWFQETGNKPIILMGGGTTKLGDPSGRDESRQLLTGEQIQDNIDNIKTAFSSYIDFEEDNEFNKDNNKAIIVNNDDWLKNLNYIEFLRDYGRHFSINRMLSMESVKQRLDREQSLSFLEFNYMIVQGYDFLELKNKFDCQLQFSGSDQWGNIVNGIELTRRVNSEEVYGLTAPLITKSDGKKMGKSVSGAIWLNDAMLPSYDYYQFWRNTDDADVEKMLKTFTCLPMDKVNELSNLTGAGINEAKKILAFEATKLCHGEEAAKQAEDTAVKLFEKGVAGGELPIIEIPKQELSDGISIIELLKKSGLANSNGEAKRLIQGGGAKINDDKITDITYTVSDSDINDNAIKLSSGKKKHILVKSSA